MWRSARGFLSFLRHQKFGFALVVVIHGAPRHAAYSRFSRRVAASQSQ